MRHFGVQSYPSVTPSKFMTLLLLLKLLILMARPAGVELASETEKIDAHIHQSTDSKLLKYPSCSIKTCGYTIKIVTIM